MRKYYFRLCGLSSCIDDDIFGARNSSGPYWLLFSFCCPNLDKALWSIQISYYIRGFSAVTRFKL